MTKKLAIAVDIGGTNLRTAIIDGKGKVTAKNSVKTMQKGKSGIVVASQVIGLIKNLIGGYSIKKFRGIGVSVAGPIDPKNGASINIPNINFKTIPIVAPLKNVFRLPVNLMNDCNAGVLGEKYFGAGKKTNNLVYITISSGIGGGVIIDGRLILGKDQSAGEVGHMLVDTEYFLPCTCGKGRGHWEAYASGNNLPKFFRVWTKKTNLDLGGPSVAEEIFGAAKRKNRIALRFMEELGKINGRGISNVIAAYNPELIIFSGSVALNNGEILLKYGKKYIDKFLRTPKLKISEIGENAPLLGVAASILPH